MTSTNTNTDQEPIDLTDSHTASAPAGGGPVTEDQRAVIAVFTDVDSAQDAVEKLVEAGIPASQVSIIGQDLQSEIRLNGFVSMGDVVKPMTVGGALFGGLFGALTGVGLLFLPLAGPLIVLGPLAATIINAAQGALAGAGVGAIVGHFVEKDRIPKYEQLIRAGSYLVVVYGTEEQVTQAEQILTDAGSTDVDRHDSYRGPYQAS